jgi:hypothetical protein
MSKLEEPLLTYDFFYNPSKIANQELVRETIAYFETGPRKGLFEPLEFMNLLYSQYQLLIQSLERPHSFVQDLLQLPLDETQKHVLLGFIIKWFGGYPVNNMNPEYDSILKLIETEFFKAALNENTPELAFCASDKKFQKKMRDMEIILNSQLGNGNIISGSSFADKIKIDFKGLPGFIIKKIYQKFEHLTLRTNEDFLSWRDGIYLYMEQIPEEFRKLTLEKGIEYGEKVLQYHIDFECHDPINCTINENMNRRLTLAKALFAELYPEPVQIDTDAVDLNTGNPEFTTSRQVLAMHYLFEHCNVVNVDTTEKARFIQFLTGREINAKNIGNTNIYKKLKSPFPQSEKSLINDLQFIRTYFEKLGLIEIVNKINKEIGTKS